MSTLTKLVLGAMGRLRPQPSLGDAPRRIELPAPVREGGLPLMQALGQRRSSRDFRGDPLTMQTMSDLLWAAGGVNREGDGRTTPSALNAREIVVYVALPQGAYRYEPTSHALTLAAGADLRRVTGYQDFVDEAPMDLVFVADHARMALVPAQQREAFAYVAAGAAAQNVYLYCASSGLSAVLRAWIDREAIAQALGLSMGEQVLLSQTVGYPKDAEAAEAR